MTRVFKSYIDGQWVSGSGGSEDENPANLIAPVGTYGLVDAAQTAQAVKGSGYLAGIA